MHPRTDGVPIVTEYLCGTHIDSYVFKKNDPAILGFGSGVGRPLLQLASAGLNKPLPHRHDAAARPPCHPSSTGSTPATASTEIRIGPHAPAENACI